MKAYACRLYAKLKVDRRAGLIEWAKENLHKYDPKPSIYDASDEAMELLDSLRGK
jgi:hypothetical protein